MADISGFVIPAHLKICSCCRRALEKSQFYKGATISKTTGERYLFSRCVSCVSDTAKAKRAKVDNTESRTVQNTSD